MLYTISYAFCIYAHCLPYYYYGYLELLVSCIKLNIGVNWWQKYKALLLTSTHCLLLQPLLIRVNKTHVGEGIGELLPGEWWGMDEHDKTSNKRINAHHKHMEKHNLIKIHQKPITKINIYNFWAIKKVPWNS